MCRLFFSFILTLFMVCTLRSQNQHIDELMNMSLEDLMSMEIISASNKKEKLSDAPATVLVISKEEIKQRGYVDLVEIFNDLPGIDISITWGDLYFRPYWRGFRKGASSTFLFMVDGLVMNHLWFNWTDVMVAVPLSSIEQIEVVYGPASSVYGANALMGVFNIITQKDTELNGVTLETKVQGGSLESRVADVNFFYKNDDFRLRLNGFVNDGDYDRDSWNKYEYTNDKYLTDRSLWGSFLDLVNLNKETRRSDRQNRAFTLNAYFAETELGAHFYQVDDGVGANYAFDKMLMKFPYNVWVEEDLSLYIRNQTNLSDDLGSSTLVRYRTSDVPNQSNSLEGFNVTPENPGETIGLYNETLAYGDTAHIVTMGQWQSLNESWTVEQSFDYIATEKLTLKAGYKYEVKYFQKAYDLPYGIKARPDSLKSIADYPFPETPENSYRSQNRVTWKDEGVYLQTRYDITDWLGMDQSQYLNFGVRYDQNSFYGDNTSLRFGYVGGFDQFGFKLLYGEAIQEPTPRQLYGGWGGAAASPTLKAENAKTLELSVDYTTKSFSLLINPYFVTVTNAIVLTRNSGEMNITGFDVHAKFLVPTEMFKQLKLWSYYTFMSTDEEKFDTEGKKTGKGNVGDIAEHKFYFGATAIVSDKLDATLRGRFIGEKPTFDTNPIRSVDGYITLDFNANLKHFLVPSLTLSLKVNNLLDETYFHPGVRDASAGNTPGKWNSSNVWSGSNGWSNSLLPQPGRTAMLSLLMNY